MDEIIKMSPVIRECEKRRMNYFILHTGQHYSYNMDRVFFEQLGLPEARYNLKAGSGAHGEQTGRMMVLQDTRLNSYHILKGDFPILNLDFYNQRTYIRCEQM